MDPRRPVPQPMRKLDIIVPVCYRIIFYDNSSELNPTEGELHISPTTTVRQLVSKTWREECFAYEFAAEIKKIEYVKFRFSMPSSRHEPTDTMRLLGFFVELYAERGHEEDSVFSKAALRKQKRFANAQGKPRYQTRSVSQGQGRKTAA